MHSSSSIAYILENRPIDEHKSSSINTIINTKGIQILANEGSLSNAARGYNLGIWYR
ncbi:hypothetical protein DAPPUDRAFT_235574 [Daphnia pulex]|uniref:Uncharacterized protein n=1 Tax=Daphnia pulex TaxID=6669 RepID=E9G085_DAPPU|nr:hypothetical protein DAPPUDRAFT_235574 [Daphnia pulex]|eukprot:EFX86857.1 hypothetical protein DAPPUDRAFT_235574 [Daphnia pulex]